MEEKLRDKIITVIITVTILIGLFSGTKASENSNKENNDIAKMVKYKEWTKVNSAYPDRQILASTQDCVPPTVEQEAMVLDSEHKDKYITVYVNDIGKQSMFQQIPKFPVGSIIVKEKFPSKNSESPELLTAMVKRQKGFNSKYGDWEVFVLNGSISKILSSGKLDKCQSCHFTIKDKDFVFRTYLFDSSIRRNP